MLCAVIVALVLTGDYLVVVVVRSGRVFHLVAVAVAAHIVVDPDLIVVDDQRSLMSVMLRI